MGDILIVDDERDIRELIGDILEDEGFATRLAGNSNEAMAEVNTEPPALMILDIWLKDSRMDGIDILKTVKRDNPGIPVVIIDSALTDGAKGTYQAFLSTDNCAAGEEVAKRMIDEAGTEGKVAVMSYVAGVGSEIGRVGCFSDYLTANSDLEIVGPYYSQSQMAQALNQTTDILASNPDLVGIFGANEPTAVGMGRAIMQAGKAGQLVALGFDGNEDLQQFVREGLMEATAVQGSFAMGEKGVNAIIDILGGEKVEPFINTGVVLVDQENIDSDQAKNVLY